MSRCVGPVFGTAIVIHKFILIRVLVVIVHLNSRSHSPSTPPLSNTSLPSTISCSSRRHRW